MFRTAIAQIVKDKGSPTAKAEKNLYRRIEQMANEGALFANFGSLPICAGAKKMRSGDECSPRNSADQRMRLGAPFFWGLGGATLIEAHVCGAQ
jgi:hypothetical protein